MDGGAPVTIVGGGLAGLTAAISCAEHGAKVTLHEAHSTLGGRARSTPAPYVANDGPHAFYDGTVWRWLASRGLVTPAARLGVRQLAGVRVRHAGRLRRVPPRSFLSMVSLGRRKEAPIDRTFRDWASDEFGVEAADAAAGMVGPALYDADPGRLSAAFVFERFLRVTTPRYPPITRYPRGGWGTVIARMSAYARSLGVRVETDSRVTELPTTGPVIVATSLDAARVLLDDSSLTWESGRVALLDLGVRRHRRDPFLVFDFDHGGFAERFNSQDPSLAPPGEWLIQGEIPLRDGETKKAALTRLEGLLDMTFPDWRSRVVWRRDQSAVHRTGALDLPGYTWRDRPSVTQGDDRYLAGDMVAAPGLLSEVSVSSALAAAALAVGAERHRAAGRS